MPTIEERRYYRTNLENTQLRKAVTLAIDDLKYAERTPIEEKKDLLINNSIRILKDALLNKE